MLKEVRSTNEDNLEFLNEYMRTCWESIGQPRPPSCPLAGLAAMDTRLTCNEIVGLLRGIVVPLSLVDTGRAEAITSELARHFAACLLCAASDHCKRRNCHSSADQLQGLP